MGFVSGLLGIIGFTIGIPIGLLIGYFLFIYYEPRNVKDPIIRPLYEFDSNSLFDIYPDIPMWVKHPDYNRIDWVNKFLSYMWPYLDKAICGTIRSATKPIFAEYIGKYLISSIDFKTLSLGTLPPLFHGMKIHETNENELVFEPAVRWAGNPDITLVLKVLSLQISLQLLDVQVSLAPRIVLKPLMPTFPCFSNITVSLLHKPDIDFGLKLLGVDLMAIPGLYRFVQETIKKQIVRLYHWPQFYEIPILDGPAGGMKKPVGILHVKVVRAVKLLKMDFMGASDPYVKLSLSGERLPAKKTTIKMKNLNPVWNEEFKLTVKDLQAQVLQLHVYDWEKVGTHDKLGMQIVSLRSLTPYETKEFTLDLIKNLNLNDPHNKKRRGQLVVEMTYKPFREDNLRFSGPLELNDRQSSAGPNLADFFSSGLLLVVVKEAKDVEGKHHTNPYALIVFRGEEKRTKPIRKTRNPCWNEEFQFLLEEPPLKEKIHIDIISKRFGIGFRPKEPLGYVDINLADAVSNGRINEKYHLINSKNGILSVEIRWKVI
ncbi:hypothetical protein ACFE04_001103 [Oxalis oulophora]